VTSRSPDEVVEKGAVLHRTGGLSWSESAARVGFGKGLTDRGDALRSAVARLERRRARESVGADQPAASPGPVSVPVDPVPPPNEPLSLLEPEPGEAQVAQDGDDAAVPRDGDERVQGEEHVVPGDVPNLGELTSRLEAVETRLEQLEDPALSVPGILSRLDGRIVALEDVAVADGSRLDRLEATKTPDLLPQLADIVSRVGALEETAAETKAHVDELVNTINGIHAGIWSRLKALESKP